MPNPVDELHATAARLKRETDELMRKIEALPRADDSRGRDAPLTDEQIFALAQRAVEVFEKRDSRPVHVTIKQAAAMLGLSRPTVSKMLKYGGLRYNRCGRIPVEQVDMVLARSKKQ